MTSQPYRRRMSRLSWVTGFSSILVFMAGAMSLGHLQASTVVVSMSSARPWASLAHTLAVAGATSTRSVRRARETCSTWWTKFRSKVSTMVRFPVSSSKVSGVMNSVAWAVITTSTQQRCFTSAEASAAAL